MSWDIDNDKDVFGCRIVQDGKVYDIEYKNTKKYHERVETKHNRQLDEVEARRTFEENLVPILTERINDSDTG